MANQIKRENTKYPGIKKYETQRGTRYQVRISYREKGVRKEFFKGDLCTLAEARSIYADASNKIHRKESPKNDPQESKPSEMTIAEYYQRLKDFKLSSKVWNANTLKVNDERFKVLGSAFGDKRIAELTRADYQKWINKQYEEKNYTQGTIEGYHSLLMLILNDAVEEDYLDKNRLKKVNLVQEGYIPKEKTITLDQYSVYMETAERVLEGDKFTMIYISSFGLRRGEVYGIKPDAIEYFMQDGIELAIVYIRCSITKSYPMGNKPKTNKSARFVVLNEKGTQLIKKQVDRCKRIMIQHDKIMNTNDFIFVSPDTAKPYYLEVMNEAMRKVEASCDIKAFPHMMRHMFATAANIADVDGDALRDFMGHESEAMTNHYTHATKEAALKVMRKTEAVLHKSI